ncbi:MAG: 5-bromo-4-chloroindolyl phosphate hydrolysis family protein [Lachnospiraceae bacterium]|nr:5-bromo-4-chloroindolyl phosphate hydrolysis family protein [Lachnospiraceae bacterium]
MQNNDWVQVGENIKECVINAVENKNFEGLSKTIEDSVNSTIGQINDRINEASKSFGFNQMKSSTYHDKQKYEQSQDTRKTSMRQQQAVQQRQMKQVPVLYAKNPPGTYSGPVMKVLGIIGTSMTGIAAFVLTTVALVTGSAGVWLANAIVGGGLVGSIAMLRQGVKLEGALGRFKKYVARIGNTQYCSIEQLAGIVGKKKSFVEKEVRKMIDKGYFLQGHIDDQGTTLITSDFMYKKYLDAEQSRRTREIEMAKKEKEVEQIRITELNDEEYPENVRNILKEGKKYIQHIRESNDAIPGEVMSQKLDTLEDIMSRIFDQLKKQPDSAEDLQKMMKYYLPTTTKLIDAYKELDGQPSYGENNIANTKKEIEDTLDVINAAFGKLFDDMFEDAAWDISTEISTMKTMLAKEGLTGERDFQLK